MSEIDSGELDFFTNYFESKKCFSAFPFVIFCDHMPVKTELDNILNTQDIYQKQTKPFILVLKKKDLENISDYWSLLFMGMEDVIEWTNKEEEIVCYLESKYSRNIIIKEAAESSLVKELLIGDCIIWKSFLHDLIETILFSRHRFYLLVNPVQAKN